MTSRARQWVRSGAAFGALALIVIGIPVLLVTLGGWPLPSAVPDWDRVRVAIVQGDLPASTVIKALAVVVWLVWVQLVWALAWELAVNVGKVDRGERPRRAPLVTPMVHAGIGRLVAIAFSVGIAAATVPTPILAQPPAHVAHEYPEPPSAVAPTPAPVPNVAGTGWLVHRQDSLWRIAEQALGDGSRATEILDLNPLLLSARDVEAGQVLRLPADAVIPADRLLAEPAPPAPATTNGYLAASEVVIEPGDNLWNLSADRLAAAEGVPVSESDVLDYVHDVIDVNAEQVDDPNLIYPGEVFSFPAIGDPPPPRTPPPLAASGLEPVTEPVPVASVPEAPAAVLPTPSVETAPPTPRSTRPPATQSPPGHRAAATTSSVSDGEESAVSMIAGIAGATALATGLLVGYRRRQSRQAARSARSFAQAPRADPELERAMVTAADLPLLQWMNHELAAAFASKPALRGPATPLAIEASPVFGLEILWSEPVLHAPHPWEATDHGWAWRLVYDPDQPTNDSTPPPLPGLVTIGTREGRQLLVDLEAFKAVVIVGAEPARSDVLRSMLSELATNNTSADTFIHLTGIALDALAPPSNRIVQRDPSDALHLVTSTVAEHDDLVGSAGVDTTFALRSGGDAIGRELTLVVAADADLLAELAGHSMPHRGVGLLGVGDEPLPGVATILLDDDGSARLEPLGVVFHPATLPTEIGARYCELLEATNEASDNESDDTEGREDTNRSIDDHQTGETATRGASDCEDEQTRPQPPPVMVRILGTPSVAGFPTLGRLDTNLVAFLACNGGANDDQLIDAVWNGRLVERATVWNRVAKARKVLGDYLPHRAAGSNQLTLHPDIGTDLDFLLALVDHARTASTAEAIELLTDALDLVRGVPFNAPGYEWAHQQQFFARTADIVETAALSLVDLAVDVGDLAAARHATTSGLRALPANEPLYRARMRIEHAAHNPAGVHAAYGELVVQLDELADGVTFDPSPVTVAVYEQLCGVSAVPKAG